MNNKGTTTPPAVLLALILLSGLLQIAIALQTPRLALEAEARAGSIQLSFHWTPVVGATAYEIVYHELPGDSGSVLARTNDSLLVFNWPPAVSRAFFNLRAICDRPLLYVHYMPWFQSPETSGYWGWHWTMNHYDPEHMNEEGRREIASHYYPATGPYDSRDPNVLEYQLELMRLAGIDGLIVDWYGMDDFWDYGLIDEATELLRDTAESKGLGFLLCWEDQTIAHMVDNDYLAPAQALSHGTATLSYADSIYFSSPMYYNYNEHPLLMCFGPQHYMSSAQWPVLFSSCDPLPWLISLDQRITDYASGSFSWPPMWASVGGVLSPATLYAYLQDHATQTAGMPHPMASAFAGFHDIYAEAGVGESYGYLDPQGGITLQSTLELARDSGAPMIQLVTWNDYGEGTMIEPTCEFGTSYLEIVQSFRRSLDANFPYTAADLRAFSGRQ